MALTPAEYMLSFVKPQPLAAYDARKAENLQAEATRGSIEAQKASVENAARRLEIDQSREARLARQQQLAFAQQSSAMDVQAQAQARALEAQAALAAFVDGPRTGEDYARLIARFPEISESAKKAFDVLDERAREDEALFMGSVASLLRAGKAEDAKKVIARRAAALRRSGDIQGAKRAKDFINLVDTDPNVAAHTMLIGLQAAGFDNIVGGISGGNTRVSRSTTYNDGTVLQVMSNGDTRVVKPDGTLAAQGEREDVLLKARKSGVQDALETSFGRESGKLTARVDLGGQAVQSEKLGAAAAIASSEDAKKAENISTSIISVDRAISALRNGAQAGAINKMLPDVTEASAELRSAMNRMGLDVISGVTFGALSASELKVAMETAVPQNLGPEELERWLVSRRETLEKMRKYYEERAQFLATPGNTEADWIELLRSGKQERIESGIVGDATNAAPAANSAISDLLNKYGEGQ